MKAFLDHFAYHWLPHRPIPEMFEKRAVIITQCLGAGAKSAAKDIKHSLSWWGVSKIGIFTGALRYCLGKTIRKKAGRTNRESEKAISEVRTDRLYKTRTHKFDYKT